MFALWNMNGFLRWELLPHLLLCDIITGFIWGFLTFAGLGGAFPLQHTDPDYSAAYVVLETDAEDGLKGYGITFTLGRGTEVGELGLS